MSSVKIDRHSEINELLAKIYLDTKLKLSKKELLEIIVDINYEDYGLLVRRIVSRLQKDNLGARKSFIEKLSGKIVAVDDDNIDPKSIWVVSEGE